MNVSNQKVECKTGSNWDKNLAQEHDNFSNTANNCISHGVWPNQVESIISSHTEVLSSDSDLNVSSLINKLDDSFNTSKATSDTVNYVLETLVLIGSISLGLLFKSFDDELHKLNDSKNQWAKGETSQMVSEDHFVASKNGWVEFLSWSMRIIPHGTTWSNDKDSNSLEKSISPKSSENKVIKINKLLISIIGNWSENVIRTTWWSWNVSCRSS